MNAASPAARASGQANSASAADTDSLFAAMQDDDAEAVFPEVTLEVEQPLPRSGMSGSDGQPLKSVANLRWHFAAQDGHAGQAASNSSSSSGESFAVLCSNKRCIGVSDSKAEKTGGSDSKAAGAPQKENSKSARSRGKGNRSKRVLLDEDYDPEQDSDPDKPASSSRKRKSSNDESEQSSREAQEAQQEGQEEQEGAALPGERGQAASGVLRARAFQNGLPGQAWGGKPVPLAAAVR